jgi:serine phosphatase RsbU (regulator of sigma subunit)
MLQRSLLLAPRAWTWTPCTSPPCSMTHSWADFFDAFALEGGKVALLIGDVTGKGLAAATFTAEVKFALRAFLREHGVTPVLALSRLNRHVWDGQRLDSKGSGVFVCVALAVLDAGTGEAAFAVAGAEPPLVLRVGTGTVKEVSARGMMLGALPD